MGYHKPLPVKQTFITNDGIPTSRAASPAGAPMPTHGGGGGGSSVSADSIVKDIDWDAVRPDVKVCASNVGNC